MRKILLVILVVFFLVHSIGLFAQSEKRRKIVVMVIPNPRYYKIDEPDPTLNAAYNEITSYLIEHKINVIDKFYVDLALKELREKKDLDIEAASIEYGKKNMADKVIWFHLTDKSGNYADKHFYCDLKAISVRTGQINAIVSEEGIDDEDNERASAKAAKIAIEKAIEKIEKREELFTVTFWGEITLEVQDELDALFENIEGVESFDGYSIGSDKYEYRVSYLYTIRTLRNQINENSKKIGIRLRQKEGTINSLSFYMLPKPNIHHTFSYISGIGSLVSIGAGAFCYIKAESSYSNYKDAKNSLDMIKYKDDTDKFDDYTKYAGISAGVFTGWYIIEKMIIKSSNKVKNVNFGLYNPKSGIYGVYCSYKW